MSTVLTRKQHNVFSESVNLMFCFTNLEADYTCSTDLDGDGDGTKWYKKA